MISSWSKIRPVLSKALTYNLKPTEESFPELPAVLIWFRFVLAVVYGLYVGTHLTRSGVFLLQAFNMITFVPTMYCKFYLGVGADVFAQPIIFAGLINAVALCLLIWIYLFTAAHETQHQQLAALLLSAVVVPPSDTADDALTMNDETLEHTMTQGNQDMVGGEALDQEEPEF
ncbi:hypothetical protein ACA910_012278 [Epithemia clementina (nom. ined.)]